MTVRRSGDFDLLLSFDKARRISVGLCSVLKVLSWVKTRRIRLFPLLLR